MVALLASSDKVRIESSMATKLNPGPAVSGEDDGLEALRRAQQGTGPEEACTNAVVGVTVVLALATRVQRTVTTVSFL